MQWFNTIVKKILTEHSSYACINFNVIREETWKTYALDGIHEVVNFTLMYFTFLSLI